MDLSKKIDSKFFFVPLSQKSKNNKIKNKVKQTRKILIDLVNRFNCENTLIVYKQIKMRLIFFSASTPAQ